VPAGTQRRRRAPRIVIADAYPLLRAGAAAALSELPAHVVAECGDATEVLAAVRAHHPDVLILGTLGEPAVTELAGVARTEVGALVALVPPGDPRLVAELLNAQADVLVPRRVDPCGLRRATALAIAGERWIDPALMDTRPDLAEEDGRPALTTREREVLALLREGRTNRDIARTLFVSVPTVKTHLAHIYAKLGAANRNEALGRAAALGLLS